MTEMRLMLVAGLSPTEILLAATRNAARACGQVDELGTIEAGKIADLVVVKGNPLEDLSAMENIQFVLHDGVVMRRPVP